MACLSSSLILSNKVNFFFKTLLFHKRHLKKRDLFKAYKAYNQVYLNNVGLLTYTVKRILVLSLFSFGGTKLRFHTFSVSSFT
jgi:hypothetical protein